MVLLFVPENQAVPYRVPEHNDRIHDMLIYKPSLYLETSWRMAYIVAIIVRMIRALFYTSHSY